MKDPIYLLHRSLKLHQAPHGFKSGMDAVFLASACPARDGESVLDLGCGIGTAGLCLMKRVPGLALSGIDIQDDHTALAQHNATENGFEATFITGDIQDLKNERFDHVICNPPYLEKSAGTPSPTESIAIAKGDTDLKIWIDAALRNLKGRGTFTMIHRADMVDQIITAMDGRFGGIEIIPLWPKHTVPAKRFIMRGVKDSQSPATLHSGLILHQDNGDYTAEAENILRNAAALL